MLVIGGKPMQYNQKLKINSHSEHRIRLGRSLSERVVDEIVNSQ